MCINLPVARSPHSQVHSRCAVFNLIATLIACFTFGYYASQYAFPDVAQVLAGPVIRGGLLTNLAFGCGWVCIYMDIFFLHFPCPASSRRQRVLFGLTCAIVAVAAELWFLIRFTLVRESQMDKKAGAANPNRT
jgi:hypothetical protein